MYTKTWIVQCTLRHGLYNVHRDMDCTMYTKTWIVQCTPRHGFYNVHQDMDCIVLAIYRYKIPYYLSEHLIIIQSNRNCWRINAAQELSLAQVRGTGELTSDFCAHICTL